MTTEASTDTKLADTKLKEIIAEQEEIFVRRQPKSQRLAEQAKQHLAGGVTSSWQITAPQPVWLSRGRGSKVPMSTATSTSTCTAVTALPWPAMLIRRSRKQ